MPVNALQLPLELRLPVPARLEDFIADDPEDLKKAFNHLLSSEEHAFILLSGASGSGKTHLLSSLCHLADQHALAVIYLPLADFDELSPEVCEGLESADLICLDDIDAIAGNPQWEEALFHLYNRIRDQQKKLLVSAQNGAANLNIQLADLRSRLAWGVNLHINTLSDQSKRDLLIQRSRQMGMEMPAEVAIYLLNHFDRNLNQLMSLLEKLERASMAAKRKLTVPFIREVLPSL